jgi:hypothetical protein
MTKFAEINYGNDWGIFVDIETVETECDKNYCFNDRYAIVINDYKNINYENNTSKNHNECIKIINTVFTNLFICGFLVYAIYFVL